MESHLSFWNSIYSQFDPVAFSLFGLKVHWYGIAYACALILAFFIAKFFIRHFPQRFPIAQTMIDSYFLWAEVGVILGARLGYVLIYDPNRFYYLANPLEIFSPFDSYGNFVGISGMSFHGGAVGFLFMSWLFCRFKKQSFLQLMDLLAISVPLAYIFGRVGNFLNQELYGRIVPDNDSFGQVVGILVNGELRYPSQLLESFLEGFVLFIVVAICARFLHKNGALIAVYGIGYGVARFVAEYWREPDSQMGLYFVVDGVFGGLSMGQILSSLMILAGCGILGYVYLCDSSQKSSKSTKIAKHAQNHKT